MSYESEYNLVKLDMLRAMARSQSALALIMEHTTAAATQYAMPVSLIRQQLLMLARYQSTIITQLSGIQVRTVKRSEPSPRPWLNRKLL